ncbi:MAG: DUF1294 domain-containing protein [Clostridiales bacterium]|nr:DUF1294 domain-containing protein [Candidatus Equinaster intestinalis]
MQYFLIYFAVISFLSAVVCIADKRRAIKHKSRVSEKTLFILSFLGGAAAMYITMLLIRHKTKHKRFMIGLPLIIILHLAIIFAFYYFKTVTV